MLWKTSRLPVFEYPFSAFNCDQPGPQTPWILCSALCAVLFATSLVAQSPKPEPLSYQASGLEVPRYHLIASFFDVSEVLLNGSPSEIRVAYLNQLGIPVGTNAEQIFFNALVRVRQLGVGESTMTFTEEDGVSETAVISSLPAPLPDESREDTSRRRGETLAQIYFELETELRRHGVGMEGIEAYIVEAVAPGTGLTSSKPISEDLTAAAFESQIVQLIAAEHKP